MQQDPSHSVPQQIQPHLACVNNFRYPIAQRLNPDNVFEYLLQAPSIVKTMQPMHWEYLSAPQDGTMHLVWLSPTRQNQFATDGYVWNDPEQAFQQEVRGYTMEIYLHRSGYRYGVDQVSLHQRHRYRLVNKSNPGAASPDPNLWLVHWSACEPNMRFPVNQLQMPPAVQQQLRERAWIERQGQLVRKDFMLSDRANWPQVQFTGGQQMPPGGVHPGQMYPQGHGPPGGIARPPYYPQQHPAGPQPPPKRARRGEPSQQAAHGPAAMQAAPSMDPLILEEDTEFGDYLDNITPRELSLMRYKQHHVWMEEVFGSPYASGRILPISLGLGLAGDLEGITKGIFDAPNNALAPFGKGDAPTRPYQKLSAEQSAELEKRVADFTAKGETELEEMKREHAKLLADIGKMKKYAQAERQLSDTLSGQITGVARSNESTRSVAQVTQDVETAFNVSIRSTKDLYLREKGGFQEKKREPTPAPPPVQQPQPTQNGHHSPAAPHSAALNGGSSASVPANANALQPGSVATTETAVPQLDDAMDLQDEPGMDLLDVDGMDLDLEMGLQDTPLEDSGAEVAKSGDDWVLVNEAASENGAVGASAGGAAGGTSVPTTAAGTAAAATSSSTTAPAPAASTTAATLTANDSKTAVPTPPTSTSTPTAPGTAAANAATATKATSTPSGNTASSSGIFDGTDFGAFDNLDDTAGDALADYGDAGELELDLDDGAFGEAMMGTEGHGS